MGILDVDTLTSEDMKNAAMVQILIIRVGVDVGECFTIKFSRCQRLNDQRLETILTMMIIVVWIF